MIKIPPYLQKGDTIGLVCPAGYIPLEKVQTCINTLQEWGYNVKIGKTVGGESQTYFSGTEEERLTDFQQMLNDDEVKAVLCARGGYGTTHLIDRLDFKKFKKHPKWIVGYSDITILHSHLYTNYYISSMHAPMAGAFNDGGFNNQYVLSLKDALEGRKAIYQCPVHEFNKRGRASGELVGGNLALLAHLAGTDSDLKTKGKILFIEDVGEYLYNIERMLYQLKRSGKLSKLAGLVVGGFTESKDTDRPFGKNAFEIIKDIVKEFNYPVCFDFPISHSDRNYTLKTGVKYQLKITKDKVVLQE
jgi:muramoyltetrapeptide carboxypeptidase